MNDEHQGEARRPDAGGISPVRPRSSTLSHRFSAIPTSVAELEPQQWSRMVHGSWSACKVAKLPIGLPYPYRKNSNEINPPRPRKLATSSSFALAYQGPIALGYAPCHRRQPSRKRRRQLSLADFEETIMRISTPRRRPPKTTDTATVWGTQRPPRQLTPATRHHTRRRRSRDGTGLGET